MIGKTIARYEFTNLLGKGGMGLVYPANIAAACGIGHHDDQDSLIMELAADETPAERLGRGQPAEEQP